MNLSRKWLHEFVDLQDISDREFSDAMTLSGSKVETVTRLDCELKNVVVGKIIEMVRHENSDHMWVLQIDVGQDAPIQVVTGAQNQQVGDCVPVALHKSKLPGGVEITRGKLRGVESNGMCCSIRELGLTLHDVPDAAEDGLWIIREEVQPGDDIAKVIGYDDSVVEFEITPNRPDCLSVIGLAREASATFSRPLQLHTPVVEGCGGDLAALLDIEIEDGELCPRYTARMVKNVRIAPSPKWMRERLRNSGVRPINNIVDITNYVMLEYGQPMHAFDFSCVQGGKIIVRTAREGEHIETLDGTVRNLTSSMLCICDEEKPVCVAGVMGGANSEITGDTAMVLFESANFNGVSVRRTATALGMRTDASSRYEKGLDPMNTMKAVERACELVELLGCGEVLDGVMDVIAKDKAPTVLPMESEKINALLGTQITTDAMWETLYRLGFTQENGKIVVPSWRADVEHYADIAEEVARFYGYNQIPNTLLRGETTRGGRSAVQNFAVDCGESCRALGYDEIITYSFVSPDIFRKLCIPEDSPMRNTLRILNPLGEDTSIMRTTILSSMLEILARNDSYRNDDVRLYELGKIYLPREDGLADEPQILSLGAYGDTDFFTFKGEIEQLLAALRMEHIHFESCTDNPSYHPGRCAAVFCNGQRIGVMGQVHPTVAENFGMKREVYTAEFSFEMLWAQRAAEPVYRPLPRFPAVTRDIALVCAEEVTVGALTACIRRGGKLLESVTLFDIYRGKGVEDGKKSVAFNLSFRAEDRSLNGEEVDAELAQILTLLGTELQACLRA